MDADFSHNPENMPRLLEALGQGDVAIGIADTTREYAF